MGWDPGSVLPASGLSLVSECVITSEDQAGLANEQVKWPESQGVRVSKVKTTGRAGCWGTWESQPALCVHVCVHVST